MFTILWNDEREPAASLAGLDEALDRLQGTLSEEPTLVTVERDDGDSLSIGLGRALSVLNFVGANGDPPYYTSVGADASDGEISFSYNGSYSEYPMRNAVPIATARAALRRFCETGKLPELVSWEET